MAIDPLGDALIPMTEVPTLLPNGASGSTLRSWWKYGIRGIHLETVKIASKRYTTKDALREFFSAVGKAERERDRDRDRKPSARSEERREELVRAGLL